MRTILWMCWSAMSVSLVAEKTPAILMIQAAATVGVIASLIAIAPRSLRELRKVREEAEAMGRTVEALKELEEVSRTPRIAFPVPSAN